MSILSTLSYFASPTDLWETMMRREGWATWQEIGDDITARFGPEHETTFASAMERHFASERHRMVFAPGVNYDAQPALSAIPAPLFLDVIEDALARGSYWREIEEASAEINRLFEHRRVFYRVSGETRLVEWNGDRPAHEVVIRPALDALGDARLAGARAEFEAALAHLRKGTSKDFEDAIEEAAKSVESAMKVLAAEHGVPLTGKETARPLFDLLAKAGVLIAEADQAVLGPSRIRNAHGGHGSGPTPRQIPLDLAEFACRSSASALGFLAAALP